MALVRIHDRQLSAVQRIPRVGVDLAHHRHQRIAARDQQPLLAIGREMHVLGVHRGGGGDRDRFLPGALHVETGLALPLGAIHAIVEHADNLHVLEHLAQCVGVKPGIPRPDRLAVIVEHADEVRAQRERLLRLGGDIGARRGARCGDIDRRKIGRVAGPVLGLGHMQRERRTIGAVGGSLGH